MRLRLLLPLLALLSLGGVTWIVVRSRAETPEFLLERARARREDPDGDLGLALREVQEGLRLVRGDDSTAVRLELFRERARLHRAQGLLSLALRDLERVLVQSPDDAEVLEEACRVALWLDEPARVLELAPALEPLAPAAALAFIGQARVALADRPLARIESLAHGSLASDEEEHALRLAHRAAVFAADADLSEVAREELGELFLRAEDRRLVEELVHEAAEHLEVARRSFVASLAAEPSAEAVGGLQDLLLRAGADVDAAELGEVALSLPGLGERMPLLIRTAPTLLRLERREAARGLIRSVNPDRAAAAQLPSHGVHDELLEWCSMLEELELWRVLRPAAYELEARARRRPDADKLTRSQYFLGLCELHDRNLGPARFRFDIVSIQPNLAGVMAVRTWLALAEIAQRQRNGDQERFALLQATKFSPSTPQPGLREAQAAAWDRLARLTRAAGDLEMSEHWLTQALMLEPTTPRFERWQEEGRTNPDRRNFGGPYRSYSQALSRLERGDLPGAAKAAEELLKRYPGFAPALEIVATASVGRRDYRKAVDACLQLLEAGWRSQESSRLLAAVPPEYLVAADRLRWLRLDPAASLSPVLRHLVARGELEQAAQAACVPAALELGASDLALAGRALLEAGRVAQAERLLQELEGDMPDGSSPSGLPIGLLLRSALALANENGVDDVLQARLARLDQVAWPDPEVLQAVDELLAGGRPVEAGRALTVLEAGPSPLLGAALLRRAVLDLREAPAARSCDALERAAALLAPGLPELGRVLLAASREDFEERRREAGAALATPLSLSLGRALLLALLGEDAGRLRALLRTLPADGRDALFTLGAACLQAAGAELTDAVPEDPADAPTSLLQLWAADEDPRPLPVLPELPPALRALGAYQVASVALAADVAPWSAWALERIDAWPPAARQEPWTLFLRARALERLGAPAAAREVLDAVLESASAQASVPAALWSARAELAGPADELSFRLAWLRAAGLEDDSDLELVEWQAQARAERGEQAAAVAWLERGLAQRPGSPELLTALARLESVPGRRARAVEHWNELLALVKPAERRGLVLEVLANLRAAREAGEIREGRWWSEVEALEAELPDDPAPVRELAQRAFETPREGHGRTLALERMQRFRARTLQRPVESLRSGEARRWTRLLARFTPDGAVDFAASELAAAPYDPEVWRAWIEALIAAERWNDALADLDAILAVAPDLETVRLSALTGYFVREDAASFLRQLDEIEALDPSLLRDDAQLAFFRGVAALRSGGLEQRELAQSSWELWERRQEAGLLSQRNGRALAIALFATGRLDQAQLALSQALQSPEGVLAADVTVALGTLIQAAPRGTRLATEGPPRRPAKGTAPKRAAAQGAIEEEASPSDASPGDASPGAPEDARQPPATPRSE